MLRVQDLRRGGRVVRERGAVPASARDDARAIVARVREEGDAALRDLTRRFDGADVEDPRVPLEQLARAADLVPPDLRRAIDALAARVRELSAAQVPREWRAEAGGIRFGEVVRPIRRAGCYVPGGRASYPSSVVMTAVPARAAGVEEVAVCTPPAPDGSVSPAVLYACVASEVSEVYRVGGAHAIAALAYGTATIAAVDRIVGPGNAWVTAAKAEVAVDVAIDGLAGPTELVLVADGSAAPEVVAADLVAQAEHDPAAEAFLLTWDEAVAGSVDEAVEKLAVSAPRRDVLQESLPRATAVLVRDARHAAAVSDEIAPEHLQVMVEDGDAFLALVRAYGAAFVGHDTPVSLGDYGFGSNHVLPTLGTARFSSGLRAADFVTVSSVVEASPQGLAAAARDVAVLADAERLPGHARAVEARLR